MHIDINVSLNAHESFQNTITLLLALPLLLNTGDAAYKKIFKKVLNPPQALLLRK